MTVHFAIESEWPWREVNAACGYNFSRRKKLTDDPAEVSCVECRKLCGFDEGLVDTVGDPLGDPFERRAAA